jgi:hypothetical protein
VLCNGSFRPTFRFRFSSLQTFIYIFFRKTSALQRAVRRAERREGSVAPHLGPIPQVAKFFINHSCAAFVLLFVMRVLMCFLHKYVMFMNTSCFFGLFHSTFDFTFIAFRPNEDY